MPAELDCGEPFDAAAPVLAPGPDPEFWAVLDPLAADCPGCGAGELAPAEPPLPALVLADDGEPVGVGTFDDAGREDNESKVSAAMGDRPTGPELL